MEPHATDATNAPVFGCIVLSAGHVLLNVKGIPMLYLQSASREALHKALLDIRGKTSKDLWVIEAPKGGDYSLVATPYYLPMIGFYLPSVYSYVVSTDGINTDILKEQYNSCLEMFKFAAPPCYGCRLGSSGCLDHYSVAETLPNSAKSPYIALTGRSGYSRAWTRAYEAVSVHMQLQFQASVAHVTDAEALELEARTLLRRSRLVQQVDGKYSHGSDSGMFKVGNIPKPTDVDLSHDMQAYNKAKLRERSLASAASRKTLRAQCTKCLISATCDKSRPGKCAGAITELDGIRNVLKQRVSDVFGKVPLITDPWVQATLKLSGARLGYKDVRRARLGGRPAMVTAVMVAPPGTICRGYWQGQLYTTAAVATVLLATSRGHLEVPFCDGRFTSTNYSQVEALLALPDVVMDDDTLLRAMALLITRTVRGPWGSRKLLQSVYVDGDLVGVEYRGCSKYSVRRWTTTGLGCMHIPELRHVLRINKEYP